MDYDDNDFQGQNLHLAGEGSSKFSPVLSPYALPKFDFDDSLQGHLRFDSLVENEVFLGIPSQEDNQWIEDFSRGNSGIEFSSSVAESCSITRRNNVWSEATSSESVEMLLKSVGQEEMVPEETIIEESDACDELGSLTRQMEPNPKPDDAVKDVIDLHSAIPPEEFLGDFSGLNGGSGGVRPHVEGTSQTQEAELSAYGSSSELEPSAIGEKCGSFVNEKNQAADTKCDDANKAEADATVNESLNDKTQEDLPLCGMKIDCSTSQDCVASIGELYNQGIPHDVREMSFENAEGLSKDDGEKAEEHHVESKDDSMNGQNLKGTAVETGSKLEPVEAHAVETSVNNFEVPLPLPLERDADLQIAEYCEDVISTNPSLGRECGDMVLSQSTGMNQQPKADMREATVIIQGEDNFERHAADISSVDEKECFIGSDSQLVSEASVHNSEASLLSGVDNKLSNDVGDGSSNNHEGDLSNLTVACSSTELLGEKPATDNSDVIDDTSQIVKEGSNAEKSILPPMLAGSLQISEEVVTKQSNRHGDQEVSLSEKGKAELPTDHSSMDCETVGSLNKDNVVESSSLDEGSEGNDVKLQKSEFDTASMNESALDVPLENMNIGSHNALDGVPLPSETGAIAGGVTDHGEEQKSPSPVVGLMDLDKTEADKVEVPTETSILTLKECMGVASEVGPLAGLETGSGDSAGHLPQETTDQSLPVVKLCNTSSMSEQAVVPNEVNQEDSEELEDCPACDSTVKEDDNAEAVVLENNEEATREGNHKVAPSEIAESCNNVGNVHEGNDAIIVSTVDDCERMSSKVEGGGSFTDSDKPTSASSIVTSCTVLSQSEKDWNEGVNESPEKSVPVSETTDGIVNNVQSTPQDQRRNDASKEGRSFTFEVSPLAAPPERETSKDWQAFPTIQACKISTIVEGSPASCKGQKGPKTVPETARGRSQTHDGENSHGSSKGTPERKTRRMSGKATGKENAKKGNHVKESPLARLSEKGDKLSSAPTGPSETGKLVQFDGMKPYGNVESATTKPCGVISIPASNLPDLNSSTPPSALFQQPFTDLQQVQLRAQIFVYGSLIQGTAPEEACMLSAFGTSDGGRNVWEPAWRICVERIQGQKSHPSNSDTPVQSRSGARASDQAIKQGAMQSKVLPSPLGRASSKGTPSPVVHPMIPLSSPLWNISTGLQSSGIARGAILDYHQPLSPLHPYQTPPTQNFVGHNTSWLSQSPFPGAWVASPQTSAFDANARFSVLPITEAVKLTPVKESSLPISSGTKHASSGPVVHGVVPSVFAGTSSLPDMKKVPGPSALHSTDPKSKKRKKVPISEDLGQISVIVQPQTESLSSPVVTSHSSIPVAAKTPASFAAKINADKIVKAVTLKSTTDKPKGVDQIAEPKVLISEETFNKVEEARLQAEDAAAHAAAAVGHSQDVWSQLDKQKNSRLISDVEANLSSAAAAIAAAAAVARAAAAAAKIASNAALQVKLMADEALFSSGTGNPTQSSAISPSDVVNNLRNATPAAILKGGDGSSCSSSIIIAAREAARRRLEAASAASKHAENLDAIVKAAELAAEAVSQAGKIVAMGDPFPLRQLVEAGPDGYWKIPQQPSEQGVKSKRVNKEQSKIERIEEGSNITAKQAKRGPLNDEMLATNHGLPPLSRQFSRDSMEDRMRVGDGISDSITSGEKNLRGQRGRRASDLSKTIGVVPESEIGTISTSFTVQNEYEKALENLKDNSIKEGCLVEVFKDGSDIKAAWFSASVLNLKDGKAFVCYTELQSDEGKLKEWVALEDEGNKAPRIRVAHPMTSVGFDGTRKRRRAAMGDYAWSVGDKVDAWVQDCWREGVVMEKNMKDETTLTIRFPAEGETSIVRAWHLRPTLIWKDGEWIEWSSAREKGCSSQGDTPQEKRLKLGSPAVGGEEKDKMPTNIETVESMKPEESHLLPLTAHEKIFNVGKHSRDENKPDALRTMRSGLQKEGSKVIFGVPKPGKKRKFMEVSKHYVAERSTKNIESSDSVKFAKYLMPQGSVSRGWKNNSKIDSKQKQAAESKPKVQKSGRPQGVSGRSRTVAQKDRVLTPMVSSQGDGTIMDHTVKDSMSNDENQSGEQSLREFGSFSNTEGGAEGPILFSSVDIQSNDPRKVSTSNAKSEQLNKGKLAPSGGRFAKVDVKDKVYIGNMGKSIPEIVEPRRSNRRIQPTSRLLEGLQSSLIISKIPSASHDKSHRSTNRGTSKRE